MINTTKYGFRGLRAIAVLAVVVIAATGISACSDNKKKPEEKPAKLVDFKPTLTVKQLWSVSVGGKSKKMRLGLRVAVAEGVAYAGGYSGEVKAVDVATGKKRWTVKTKLPLSAGPGIGQASDGTTILLFGGLDGSLIALNASDGRERWRHRLSGEVLAAPVVSDGEVVVRTADGHVAALSIEDAKVRWNYEQSVPKLSLRGNAAPVIVENAAIVAFDNGRVASLDIKTGDTQWDTAVASPTGRSELERMVDVDGAVSVDGNDVFVVSYQGRIAMLARDSGQMWWARDFSSYRGLAFDSTSLYAANAKGDVVGMRRSDGTVAWEQNALRLRALTAPALNEQALVVGDYDGYLHWLSASDGGFLARTKAGGNRISVAPVVSDGIVLVQSDAGHVMAFKTKPKATKPKT